MGYKEAIEDNVTVRNTKGHTTGYYPPCRMCGEPVFSISYRREQKYLCRDCKAYLKSISRYSYAHDESMQEAIKLMCQKNKAGKKP